MKRIISKLKPVNEQVTCRGESPSRLDNLTDAVFGIAITLLIFNISNPNSFSDLIEFTKTLPAFLLSIAYLMLIWMEHANFSLQYGLNDAWLKVVNTVFIGFIIFYVYPLRFLSLLFTQLFYTDLTMPIQILVEDIPNLMIYYGWVVFALYFLVFLFFLRALQLKNKLELNSYEILHTKLQAFRVVIMFAIPLLSIICAYIFRSVSISLASIIAGLVYSIYVPAIIFWKLLYAKKIKELV